MDGVPASPEYRPLSADAIPGDGQPTSPSVPLRSVPEGDYGEKRDRGEDRESLRNRGYYISAIPTLSHLGTPFKLRM